MGAELVIRMEPASAGEVGSSSPLTKAAACWLPTRVFCVDGTACTPCVFTNSETYTYWPRVRVGIRNAGIETRLRIHENRLTRICVRDRNARLTDRGRRLQIPKKTALPTTVAVADRVAKPIERAGSS